LFAATSFSRSHLQPLIPVLDIMPHQLPLSLRYMLNSMTGLLSLFFLLPKIIN
jgi:hypothetical protein